MNEWFEYSKELTSKGLFDKLPAIDKKKLKEYKEYALISASESRALESIREILRFQKITNKPLGETGLEDLRHFLGELKKSTFADYTKNKIKVFIQKFLRWNFKDWSLRFDNFEDIKENRDAHRKEPITSKDVLSKEDIEKIMKAEPTLFWKTFFIVQYEGALRTGETRRIKWSDVTFDDDDFVYISVSSKKNKNGTSKFRELPFKDSAYYLKQLKEEQKNKGVKTEWVFPSPKNPNKPISKAVNTWFKELTKRAIGRNVTNYLLRHSRGTELKRLVKEGVMSKDNAIDFMGHSEKMFDKVYSHMDKDDVKKLLKKQLYNFQYMPPEKKKELEKEIGLLKKEIDEIKLQRPYMNFLREQFLKSQKKKKKKGGRK